MRFLQKAVLVVIVVSIAISYLFAQEESQPVQVLNQEGYDKAAPAVVKIVSDAGRNIGTGVILAVHQDQVGFILTSYSMVAGRDKVAVILKNYPDALLGYIVDKWIDFDLDLAIVGVKNFPAGQPTITLGDASKAELGKTYTILAHTKTGDWYPIPAPLNNVSNTHLILEIEKSAEIEGAPVLTNDGNMIGLMVVNERINTEVGGLTAAVKSNAFKPIIKEWFKSVPLQQKWQEKGVGFATWIWAVGGGVIGGGIATAIAISSGGEEAAVGLPRPPEPPQ